MNRKDKDKIIERYTKRLEQHGATIEALSSGKEERRQLRFKILSEIGIKAGDKILDLGCGFGDLIPFLEKTLGKDQFEYTGVDINEKLVAVAKERFPGYQFMVKDIIQEPLAEQYDYILSTTCFNLRLEFEDNYDFVEKLLKQCYKNAGKGVAIDFLSSYVDFRGVEEAFYYEPEKIFTIAKKITKRVNLRHDYPLFEFCIYLFPDFKGWQTS
jgi:SAM-dependent methyltransferase